MSERPFPSAPDDSELQRWMEAGKRHEAPDESVVTIESPDEQYRLTIAVDDPASGYRIELHTVGEQDTDRLSQMIVDDERLGGRVAAEMAGNADDLAEVADDEVALPDAETEPVDEPVQETPDDWPDDEEEAWDDALEKAHEKAGLPRSKGTITTKTIDGRDYYYLQWRESEDVKSQYIAPVNPS